MTIFTKKHTVLYILILLAVAAAILAVIFIHIHNVHTAQHKSGRVASTSSQGQTSNITPQKNRNSGSSTPTTSTTKSDTTTQSPPPSGNILSPSGTFVSNHHPGQNGTPTAEESVCNTTPYAQCDIQFTSNGIVKDLGFKTTDANGSAFWQWDINGSDIGPGEWQITAVAKLGSQIVETNDSLKLEVQ